MCYSHLSYDDIHIATYKPHAVFKSWGREIEKELQYTQPKRAFSIKP